MRTILALTLLAILTACTTPLDPTTPNPTTSTGRNAQCGPATMRPCPY